MGANNFMWLVNDRTGKRVQLAGWWPDFGWQAPSGQIPEDVAYAVLRAFVGDFKANGASGFPSHGNTDWRIEYEYAQGEGPGDRTDT